MFLFGQGPSSSGFQHLNDFILLIVCHIFLSILHWDYLVSLNRRSVM